MKPLLLFLIFVAGFGTGCFVLRGSDKPEPIGDPAAKPGQPTIASAEIHLKRAEELQNNYRTGLNFVRPRTDAVVHDLGELIDYLTKMRAVLANNLPGMKANLANAQGPKLGVAFYFGDAYKGNYAQENNGKFSYLFENNATVFLMPCVFTEKSVDKEFKYIDIQGQISSGVKTVKVLDYFSSALEPLSYNKFQGAPDFFDIFKAFLEDEGFDLGHTKP